MPAPLPPQPAVDLTGELPALLSAADRAMARLDGSVLTLPNADQGLDCRPEVQAGGLGQADVLGHATVGDPQRQRDLLVRQASVVLESKKFLDHA